MDKSRIYIDSLAVGYGKREVLSGLNLELKAGELTALLGPNGAGKSTLIRSISGVQQPLKGQVHLNGKALASYHQKDLAKEVSLVLTNDQAPGNLSVYALVALGRFPYTSWIGRLSPMDKEVILWALRSTGMLEFADRHIGSLSDGERQKVMIARALAQQTDIIILDEPTAHLDTPNRLEVFHLLKDLVSTTSCAILVSTHDIETALAYSDKLWLVHDNAVSAGIPEDLVINGSLEKAFSKAQLQFDYGRGAFRKSTKRTGIAVALKGDELLVKWLTNALERKGFSIQANAPLSIEANGTLQQPQFGLSNSSITYPTIEQLLFQLNNGKS